MTDRFDYFVVFADMRTGSNFLEASLNGYDGLSCHGELFNPHFIGHEGCRELAGVSLEVRDQDPHGFLGNLLAGSSDLSGFRFFNDHDPRMLEASLTDPRAAKIILTRDPLDSYISLKIARATGQWRLGGKARAKTAQVDFDAAEFRAHLDALGGFRAKIQHGLQTSGQTAFHLAYDDLRDVDVLNGLARWLGVSEVKAKVSGKTRVQNPAPLSEKVGNFEAMERALADLDRFGLHDQVVAEPRRGSNIPHYLGGDRVPLLFMPIPGGQTKAVEGWLKHVENGALVSNFNQKTLRQWMRKRPGHHSFTVLRHPLARAHHMFATRILPVNDKTFLAIREQLRDRYKMAVPDQTPDKEWRVDQHHDAFLVFLRFVKDNLAGQTSARTDAGWASQAEILRGFAEFAPPDAVLREDQLQTGLDRLSADVGADTAAFDPTESDGPWSLDQIWSEVLEQACRATYARDYLIFGWQDWSGAV